MGAVLRGRDTELNRDLAVKVLLDQFRGEPEVLRRFFEEAQIGGQLQHPGIVPIYDIGTLADNRPFFAMKWVKGRTLAELLKERGSTDEDLARFLGIFEQVAQTVSYAHSKGVIHRDLKPANIMVGVFGEVQVMDWGLAKVLPPDRHEREPREEQEPITTVIRTLRSAAQEGGSVAGSVMGTYAYMPPEQANGEIHRVDERADVFGLGSILCEILTGFPAYRGPLRGVQRMAELGELADAMGRLEGCGAEEELVALATMCLGAEPSQRPADASVVAGRVSAYVSGVQQRLRASEIARVEANARAETERLRAEGERARRKLTAAVASATLVAVLVGGGSWMAFRLDRDARRAEADRVVGEALGPAETLRDEAERAGPEAIAAWERAMAAAQRATDALVDRPVGPILARRARELDAQVTRRTAEVRDAVRKAESMRKLVSRLDEARLQGATIKEDSLDARSKIEAYEQAFREAGVSLQGRTVGAIVEELSSSEDREQVAAALDDWRLTEARPSVRETLDAVARAIDPASNAIRDALRTKDPEELMVLGLQILDRDPTPVSVVMLAAVLEVQKHPHEAIVLLGASRRRHPGDFWINHDLGRLLCNHAPARGEEAIRYLTIAVALKPDSVGAMVNLAHAMCDLGDPSEAVVAAREAIRLKPDLAHAHTVLGNALVNLGRLAEAEASYRRSIAIKPQDASPRIGLGGALARMGRLGEAESSYRMAIRLRPESAEAHYLLGLSLQSHGLYRESLDELIRGDALGSGRPGWPYPSGAVVEECRALIAVEDRLPALIRGEIQPRGEGERMALGRLCYDKRLYATAVRFWSEALDEDPALGGNLRRGVRFRLACAAALAGTGLGDDIPKPGDSARLALRERARGWLEEDLEALRRATLESGNRAFVAGRIVQLKKDPDLAGVRTQDGLARLGADERKAWRSFWSEAENLAGGRAPD